MNNISKEPKLIQALLDFQRKHPVIYGLLTWQKGVYGDFIEENQEVCKLLGGWDES